MSEAHSKYSASGFAAAMLCPGKRVMERGLPNKGSKYADEGTAAHALLEHRLLGVKPDPDHFVVAGHKWLVTKDMSDAVATAITNIRAIAGDGMVLAEQRVNYSKYLGVAKNDAWGTSDVIAVRDNELQVHDYKHGMGVEVDAQDNAQMMLYGLGSLASTNDSLGPFDTVRMVIHQPRINAAPSEHVVTVDALEAWGYGTARTSRVLQDDAEKAFDVMSQAEWEAKFLRPNEKSCKFCRAKSTCNALRSDVAETVFEYRPASPDEFEGLQTCETPKQSNEAWLAAVMVKADMIEDYLSAVRAEVAKRLAAGKVVPGYKLVKGRQGNRSWSPDAQPAELLQRAGVDEDHIYEKKLISPTDAEKLAKAGIIPSATWSELKELTNRLPGKPSVARESDKRPAISLAADASEFEASGNDL